MEIKDTPRGNKNTVRESSDLLTVRRLKVKPLLPCNCMVLFDILKSPFLSLILSLKKEVYTMEVVNLIGDPSLKIRGYF